MHGQLDSTSAFSKGMMAAPTTKATCRGQRPNSHKSESGKHHLATLFITRALKRVLTPAEVLLHLFFNTERVMVLQLVLTSQKLSLLIMTKNYCLRKYKWKIWGFVYETCCSLLGDINKNNPNTAAVRFSSVMIFSHHISIFTMHVTGSSGLTSVLHSLIRWKPALGTKPAC